MAPQRSWLTSDQHLIPQKGKSPWEKADPQTHYGQAVQLHNGLRLVDGHSWMAVDANLVDVVHGTPAETEPMVLRLTGDDLRLLTSGGQLTVTTFDGAPAHVALDGKPQ